MIRLASVAARFKHGGADGFDLGRTWSEFKALTPEQREILRERHGRWIRIHPDDRAELERYDLRFVGGQEPLARIETKKPAAKADKSDTSTSKAPAAKADEKKG